MKIIYARPLWAARAVLLDFFFRKSANFEKMSNFKILQGARKMACTPRFLRAYNYNDKVTRAKILVRVKYCARFSKTFRVATPPGKNAIFQKIKCSYFGARAKISEDLNLWYFVHQLSNFWKFTFVCLQKSQKEPSKLANFEKKAYFQRRVARRNSCVRVKSFAKIQNLDSVYIHWAGSIKKY